MSSVPYRLAYFISPHGYGHAARGAAVMAALAQLDPSVQFEIFTHSPARFFEDSLQRSFGYHPVLTDIGLAQIDAMREDLPETRRRLADFLPFAPDHLTTLAQQVRTLGCQLIGCDISPLGLAVASAAGLPGVLVENFTWDWIYQGYLAAEPGLEPYINLLQELFASAAYHIQTEPVCRPMSADLTTGPVSRHSRTPASLTRHKLGLPAEAQVVLLTMGGIPWDFTFLEQLTQQRDCYFIIPGGSQQQELRANLALLPHHSNFFHPDLVAASDAVIGKLGYSTLAEVYQAGTAYGYIPRPDFRESEVLQTFVDRHVPGLPIPAAQFENGEWLARLPELLAMPRLQPGQANGAVQVARFIYRLLRNC
jgi:hypothetical protein